MDRPKSKGLRMVKKVYPTSFLIGLESRLLEEIDIGSSTNLMVLAAIRTVGLEGDNDLNVGVSYKEIKLSINCSHENLSKALKALESKGLLLRRRDHNDRRVIRYQMTEVAWKLIGAADNFVAQQVMRFMVDGFYPG